MEKKVKLKVILLSILIFLFSIYAFFIYFFFGSIFWTIPVILMGFCIMLLLQSHFGFSVFVVLVIMSVSVWLISSGNSLLFLLSIPLLLAAVVIGIWDTVVLLRSLTRVGQFKARSFEDHIDFLKKASKDELLFVLWKMVRHRNE